MIDLEKIKRMSELEKAAWNLYIFLAATKRHAKKGRAP